jgi:TolB-like protein/Tfp pilus assembly protein PilF
MPGRRYYEFDRFRLDAAGRVLYRHGETVPLPPKVADTLLLLVENAGQVVEKLNILKTIWPDTFVEEGSLTRAISILRKALAEGGGQEYIVTVPKRGYRFASPVKEIPTPQAHSAVERIMLAVLPFENLSGESRKEYFSDGLTEEMITQLGRLHPERLAVIARTSAMKYKCTKKSIQQIGGELGVSHVLEGSVRRAGRRVRITAQLIQVSDQTHLWAESYDRDMGDILALQSSVAQAIAKEIEIKLAPEEQARLDRASSVAPQAYEAYLQGRYLWNKRTPDSLQNSIRYFEKAIQIDANFAAAHAGLADSYLTLQDDGQLSTLEGTAKAEREALKALRIDEAIAEPHISLAHAHFHLFKWPEAEKEFKRGIELNPNYATAHFYYSNYLQAMVRMQEAITEARRAQTLDPVSLPVQSNLSNVLFHARRYDQAIGQSLKALEMDPNYARSHEDLGRAYEQKGMYGRAIAAFQKAVALSKRGTGYVASLAHAYALARKRSEALSLLRELKETAKTKYVSPYALALACAGLGKIDEAFDWLEQAYQERSFALPFLNVNPRLASLHSDPRFHDLLRRVGLPAAG